MGDLVTPVIREVSKPEKPYTKLSIRSHAKGTYHQLVNDPSKVAMDKLYVVKENDLQVIFRIYLMLLIKMLEEMRLQKRSLQMFFLI